MYEGVEHSERFAVFKANLKKIAEHNKLYEAGEETFHMAVNQFADMTSDDDCEGRWSDAAVATTALRVFDFLKAEAREIADDALTSLMAQAFASDHEDLCAALGSCLAAKVCAGGTFGRARAEPVAPARVASVVPVAASSVE